jgi:peroxiredoxin
MPVNAPNDELSWKAPNFELLSVDNKYYSFNEIRGEKGTVIAFICNHCPYVLKIIKRLVLESIELKKIGITTCAIMSNDANKYPQDSFDNMKKFSNQYQFNFKYLFDEHQLVAKNYKAVCTPDIYGFNEYDSLQYRGRIDSGVMNNDNKDINRELFYAMELIAKTNKGPSKQFNSFGCSIKWKSNE